MAADSRVWRDVRLTPVQELHERLMKDVLVRVRDLDLVLKGGSALAFTRGLNRHSTDLDFDANRGVELSDRIEAAAGTVGVNLGPVDGRNWSDHQRFLADYPNPFGGKQVSSRSMSASETRQGLRISKLSTAFGRTG